MKYVQSFIANISFPTSLDELLGFSRLFDLEMILGNEDSFDEDGNFDRHTAWTAPKWCKKDDIVFFMHAKTADAKISKLKKELLEKRNELDNDEFWVMMNAIFRAKQMHKAYGGKIVGIGRVSGKLEYHSDSAEFLHWKSRLYAPIDSIFCLQNPIDISEFNSFINVSRQSSITPVFGKEFEELKSLILKKNPIYEDYFYDSVAQPIPLKNINDDNWIMLCNNYRRCFFLESQFRSFYVDRLLKLLGDKKFFYKECSCYKENNPVCFVDNVILFNGKYFPVEIKLSVASEIDIKSQLKNYCNLDKLSLTKEKTIVKNFYQSRVLVIDTEKVYIFYYQKDKLLPVAELDTIKTIYDIVMLKDIIREKINEVY